jgi:serine/threonine-protein kinase
MSSGDWQNIERLYLEASNLPPAARSAFLDEACAGTPEVRAEVESLLDADATCAGFLSAPPSRLAAHLLGRSPGALSPGQRVDDYEVRSLISMGGMGEVYLAENIHTHQPIALKLIRRHLISDARVIDRFASEARAAGALHHKNVVTIYEFGNSAAGMFIAMEWLDGQNWRTLMNEGPAALASAAGWSAQAAAGLAAAHAAGITHRDIKPENLMLTRDGVVKILDFGLARLAGAPFVDVEAIGSSGTISGTLSGTLSYMPPELFRGESATCATDVFSLGSVFYELFTGVHPFAGETPLDVYEAIECRVPDPPSALRAGIPAEVDRLLLRMLLRDREARPSAPTVAAELEALSLNE